MTVDIMERVPGRFVWLGGLAIIVALGLRYGDANNVQFYHIMAYQGMRVTNVDLNALTAWWLGWAGALTCIVYSRLNVPWSPLVESIIGVAYAGPVAFAMIVSAGIRDPFTIMPMVVLKAFTEILFSQPSSLRIGPIACILVFYWTNVGAYLVDMMIATATERLTLGLCGAVLFMTDMWLIHASIWPRSLDKWRLWVQVGTLAILLGTLHVYPWLDAEGNHVYEL